MIAVCVSVGTVGLCHQVGWISLLVCQVVELGAVVTLCVSIFLLRPLFTGVIALRGSIVLGFLILGCISVVPNFGYTPGRGCAGPLGADARSFALCAATVVGAWGCFFAQWI